MAARAYFWASALAAATWGGAAVVAPKLDPDPVAHAPPVVLDSAALRAAMHDAFERAVHPVYDPARDAAIEAAAIRHRTFGRSAFAVAALLAFAALTLLVVPPVRRTLGPVLHSGQVVLLWLVSLATATLLVRSGQLPDLTDPDHTTPALVIGPALLWLFGASIVLPISVTWRWFGARTRRPP